MNKKTTPRNKMTGAVMRGGLDIEPRDYPDSIYWQRGAEQAKIEIYAVTDLKNDFRIDKILGKYWKHENTWMYIFDRTRRVLELFGILSL